ncbi:MAG TPA: DUF1772 domain-containing protein [Candidatus Koribacter sp.]|jgi:hypothetical protein
MRILDILTVLCAVAMTGTEFTVAFILNPALDALDEATWLRAMPALAKAMGRAMPIWYASAFALIAAEGYLRFGTDARWWMVTAAGLWASSILYSITMLVPINNRIASANGAPASSVVLEHARWDWLHRWRVALLVVATACLLIGLA